MTQKVVDWKKAWEKEGQFLRNESNKIILSDGYREIRGKRKQIRKQCTKKEK